jgi:hypothetical protein
MTKLNIVPDEFAEVSRQAATLERDASGSADPETRRALRALAAYLRDRARRIDVR